MNHTQHRSGAPGSDDIALLLGRFAIGALFLPSGLEKLFSFGKFAASMAGKSLPFGLSLPFPDLMAVIAVALEVGCPLLLILGVQTRWVAILSIAFVVMATLTTHRYWEFEGAARRMQEQNFYKNLGLIGGLLFLHVSGAGAYSWDGWRSRRRAG